MMPILPNYGGATAVYSSRGIDRRTEIMANQRIVRLFRERLFADCSDRPDLRSLFDGEIWKAQSLSTFYGADSDAENLVDIGVLRTMDSFCRETGRRLGKSTKSWLISMIRPSTVVHKPEDLASAIELMSTAAIYTTEIPERRIL